PFRVESYQGEAPSVLIDDAGDTTSHPQAAIQTDPSGYNLTGLTPTSTPIYFQLDPASSVTVRESGADDTLTLNSLPPNLQLTINGSGGADTLVGPNSANTWQVTGANAGSVGQVSFAAVENLRGGSSSDVYKFQTGGSLLGKVDGGGGTDALDYSA